MSKCKMEKLSAGSRISTMLCSLEKLNNSSSEDLEQLRYITAKLLHCIKDQEPVRKQIMSKNTGTNGLDILLSTLENSTDSTVSCQVASILLELLTTGKRASIFVSHNATQILLTALVTASRDQSDCDEFLVLLHQILSRIGVKDRKFGVKARLSGSLSITFSLIRINTSNYDILQPTLQVLKIYVSNSVNSSYLGKAGAVTCMFRIMSACGHKHNNILRQVLGILCQMVKSKSNAARAVGQNGVSMLITMLCDWQRNDVRNKNIKIRKTIVKVIRNVTVLKSGKKAFVECNGIRVLYDISQDITASHCSKDLESLVTQISVVLRKCFPHNRLPVTTIKSCVLFPLPNNTAILAVESEDDDVIDESDDQLDDEASSSDDQKQSGKNRDCKQSEKRPDVSKRSPEDLAMYDHFFRELRDFEEVMREGSDSNRELSEDQPIVIPTASSPLSSSSFSPPHQTQSSSSVRSTLSSVNYHLRSNCLSLPNLKRTYVTGVATTITTDEVPIQSLAVNVSGIRLDPLFVDQGAKQSQGNDVHGTMDVMSSSSSLVVGNSNSSPKHVPNRPSLRSTPKLRKLSRPLTSVKPVGANNEHLLGSSSRRNKVDQEFGNEDSLRATMTISRMSLSESRPENRVQTPESKCLQLDDFSPELYADLMCKTKRVLPFRRIAQPELRGHVSPQMPELFLEKVPGVQRNMIFEDIDRAIHPEKVLDRVVFDLDAEMKSRSSNHETGTHSHLTASNSQTNRFHQSDESPLTFDSQFECGNLRKVIHIRRYEYDLILNSDINSNHHHQWFYFEVSNMREEVTYRLNVINCEKTNSQFNYGMQPVLYSIREAMEGRPRWIRAGSDVSYYKNSFSRSSMATGGIRGKSYYTLAFNISFQYTNDVCYLAYHYPFTYTMMKVHLMKLEASISEWSNINYRNQSLCETLGGNTCPVLTITNNPAVLDKDGVVQFRRRPYIVLSARVHPGESNSSWVMKGVLQYLTSQHPTAQALRDTYIFKIIPMLNPDGIINGSHRCSLSGEDLNRHWDNPNPELHPTIYHAKGLLQYMALLNRHPLVFCDFHGHSLRKNIFLYGCSESQSQRADDVSVANDNGQEDASYKTLPHILNQLAPAFALSSCNFFVDKSKEGTARVVVWKELMVPLSYTMESTYCGCDQGQYKGCQITTAMLEEMGKKFCEGLLRLVSRPISDQPDKAVAQLSLRMDKICSSGPDSTFKEFDDYGSPGEDVDALIQASLHGQMSSSRGKKLSNDLDSEDEEEASHESDSGGAFGASNEEDLSQESQ